MDTFPLEQGDHIRQRKDISEDMLRLSPNEYLVFSKGEGSDSIVEMNCISRIPVTYKIQTTSPEKFRVRPRCGILNPGETVLVNILLKTEHHLSETSKDKFLVMCIPVPQGIELTSQQMSEVWKHKQFNSPEVEQHRLTCVYKSVDKIRNGHVTDEKDKTKSNQETPSSINDVSREAIKLQRQIRFMQILQYTTIVFLLILSGAVIYLLRLQTATATQDELIAEGNILGTASCPMGRRL